MWVWRLFWIAFAILLLSACGRESDTASPHWAYSCLESVKITTMEPLKVGDATTLELVTKTMCIRSDVRCVWGSKYRGKKQCPPRDIS
jgi:hypothetical protein